MTRLLDIDRLGESVAPGSKIALPAEYAGVSMAMTRQLIQHQCRELHIVCVPTGGLQVDMLIGAGLVSIVETSAVSLGEAGGAPRFVQAAKQGNIRILDATCPAVHGKREGIDIYIRPARSATLTSSQ